MKLKEIKREVISILSGLISIFFIRGRLLSILMTRLSSLIIIIRINLLHSSSTLVIGLSSEIHLHRIDSSRRINLIILLLNRIGPSSLFRLEDIDHGDQKINHPVNITLHG